MKGKHLFKIKIGMKITFINSKDRIPWAYPRVSTIKMKIN